MSAIVNVNHTDKVDAKGNDTVAKKLSRDGHTLTNSVCPAKAPGTF